MLNANVELFMSEYFLIKAVLGKYLKDSEKLFRCLSRIFLIPASSVDALYELSENELASGITTEQEFMQHQRISKYSALVGATTGFNAEWEEIVRIKGNAMLVAQGYNLVMDADVSRNMVYNCLSAAATHGSVVALRIMGVLQCEGIFLAKNENAGIKHLAKAADWNDTVSLLAMLSYNAQLPYNMSRLRQVVEDTPFAELYRIAVEHYGVSGADSVNEVKLLYKAINAGILKRDVYDSNYARILYSKAISPKDKEKAVLSPSKEHVSTIGDLPLKLTREKTVAVDVSGLESLALNREKEQQTVARALQNADLRELPSYRPVCLCCDSRYILNMYAQALNQTSETHVEVIDVAELSEYDLEPTLNNIFVRSIDEDKDNRLLLFFCGAISERKLDAVKCILQGSRRAKFHLNSPAVTLNLGAVLPICLCDKQNARLLKPYCDVIVLDAVSEEEMSVAIKDIVAGKQSLYGVGAICLDGEACKLLCGYDVDTVEKIIDAAVRAKREKGADITLTRDILQSYVADSNILRIGFGGEPYGKY